MQHLRLVAELFDSKEEYALPLNSMTEPFPIPSTSYCAWLEWEEEDEHFGLQLHRGPKLWHRGTRYYRSRKARAVWVTGVSFHWINAEDRHDERPLKNHCFMILQRNGKYSLIIQNMQKHGNYK